jgi:hypothetical protein
MGTPYVKKKKKTKVKKSGGCGLRGPEFIKSPHPLCQRKLMKVFCSFIVYFLSYICFWPRKAVMGSYVLTCFELNQQLHLGF